jgi:hypothetical protein
VTRCITRKSHQCCCVTKRYKINVHIWLIIQLRAAQTCLTAGALQSISFRSHAGYELLTADTSVQSVKSYVTTTAAFEIQNVAHAAATTTTTPTTTRFTTDYAPYENESSPFMPQQQMLELISFVPPCFTFAPCFPCALTVFPCSASIKSIIHPSHCAEHILPVIASEGMYLQTDAEPKNCGSSYPVCGSVCGQTV